jgi:NAD(P)-dependent dehydrogenase (short-subunit alcohol dehydrogenase family)
MSEFSVLITGAAGGIGKVLCRCFLEAGWNVVSTELPGKAQTLKGVTGIDADLSTLTAEPEALAHFRSNVLDACGKKPLKALVNNAAMQYLSTTDALSVRDFNSSFVVNTLAPFVLTQCFLPELEAAKGNVLNIGSVHAQATKPEFIAYATTKAALHGLTRALAVDLGGRIRVNTLAPAATATPMLLEGFEGQPEAYNALAAAHPIKRIAQAEEIASAALFLCSDEASFVTGSTLYIDGGVLSRLHDPL